MAEEAKDDIVAKVRRGKNEKDKALAEIRQKESAVTELRIQLLHWL